MSRHQKRPPFMVEGKLMPTRQYTTCYRKVRHQTIEQATDELARLKSIAPMRKLEIYNCLFCRFWHIGGIGGFIAVN